MDFSLVKRVGLVMVLAVGCLLVGNHHASAATTSASNWTWTDISSKVTKRTNRPVWTVAFAADNWYYTDGLDLNAGGRVYRLTGSTLTDLTAKIREAGLSRVDDIVSDGQTILLLKNITVKDNSFEIFSLAPNGTITNRTEKLGPHFNSTMGIASIQGNGSEWGIVTTKGNVFFWDMEKSQMLNALGGASAYANDIAYSVRHVSPRNDDHYFPVALVPFGKEWIVALRSPSSGDTNFYRYAVNGAVEDITSKFGRITYLHALASNGTDVLIAGSGGTPYNTIPTNRLYLYGSTIKDLSTQLAYVAANAPIPVSYLNKLRAAWNGQSWLLLSEDKGILRFEGETFINLGKTRDYFTSVASDGKGTFLLGGAVSVMNSSEPSAPLTAKLVKVTQPITKATTPSKSSTPADKINAWQWLTPTTAALLPNDQVMLNVGAQTAKGLAKTEIVVNGAVKHTCEWKGETSNQTCVFPIKGNEYPADTQVAMNAKVTDRAGRITWTPLLFVRTGVKPSNGSSIIAWHELLPQTDTLLQNASVAYAVRARSANGLKRTEIVVNGVVRRTCEWMNAMDEQRCEFALDGATYPQNTQVAVNAKVTDATDQISWTPLTYLSVKSSMPTPNTITQDVPSTWIWSTPPSATVSTAATFHVGAWDGDGVARIDMWVNGSLRRSCSFANVKQNVECSWDVLQSDYVSGSDVFVNAEITDAVGTKTWSAAQTYRIP